MKKMISVLVGLLMSLSVFAQGDTGGPRYITEATKISGEVYVGGQIYVATNEKVEFEDVIFINLNDGNAGIFAVANEGTNLWVRNCQYISKDTSGLYTEYSTGNNEYGPDGLQNKFIHSYGHHQDRDTLVVENVTGNGARGIWAQAYGPNSLIRIRYNVWTNIMGRVNGNLNADDPAPENSQFLIITDVQRATIDVGWNYVKNDAQVARSEDQINMGEVVSTKNNPARVHDNLIYGAYHQNPFGGGSYSGTGIQIEGIPPSQSEWVNIQNNYLIDCSNASLSISGLINGEISGNRVVSDGYAVDPSGALRYVSNKYWRAANIGNPFWNPSNGTANLKAFNNVFGVPQNTGEPSQIWNPGNQMDCLSNNECYDNTFITSMQEARAAETQYIAEWFQKVEDAGIVLGVGGIAPPDTGGGGPIDPPPVDTVDCDTVFITLPSDTVYLEVRDTIYVTEVIKDTIYLPGDTITQTIYPSAEEIVDQWMLGRIQIKTNRKQRALLIEEMGEALKEFDGIDP